jgi:16S rRNA (cytidine1402-2'-O)-methyltransferase
MLIQKGTLYIVATPIGNLGDITFRAVELLKSVDMIAAEDTRHSQKLLKHYHITTPCFALHEHNEKNKITQVLAYLNQHKSIALISNAGTPLINDPGYPLVVNVRQAKFNVVPIPGPSALITALSAAALPTDRFCFEGFLPNKPTARKNYLTKLSKESRTLVFYEAPHRLIASLRTMIDIFGKERIATIARELTKNFEQIKQGTLVDLLQQCEDEIIPVKGEFVLLVRGYSGKNAYTEHDISAEKLMSLLLKALPLKQVVTITQEAIGEKKSKLYKQALDLKKKLADKPGSVANDHLS